MKTETFDALATAGSRTSGGGAVVGVLGWLASSNSLGLLGIGIALLGALVNWYYKREANRRQEADAKLALEERHLRMDLMRRTGVPIGAANDLGCMEADE